MSLPYSGSYCTGTLTVPVPIRSALVPGHLKQPTPQTFSNLNLETTKYTPLQVQRNKMTSSSLLLYIAVGLLMVDSNIKLSFISSTIVASISLIEQTASKQMRAATTFPSHIGDVPANFFPSSKIAWRPDLRR